MRSPLITALFIAGFGTVTVAVAQTAPYPNHPVRIIVGFPAGTGPDIVARLLAQKLSEGWGNMGVIVDNKPGAGGLIAASEAARAAPDGYTLMLGETGQLSIAPSSYTKLPYDPAKDFLPVSQVVTSDFMLLVNPQKVQAKTVKDFATWTQQQKGLFMATFGAGTPGHFGAYMFADAIGQKADPVHYKSTGDALGGLFGGDVAGVFASVGLSAPNVKAGKLVALASSGAARSPALPDVPTFKEQGYPGLVFNSWFGIVAPARTPPEIVAKLSADIQKAVKSPEGKAKMEDAGFTVTGTNAADFGRIIAADTVTWGKAVAATGFKAD
ncbi:Bug family tripartite tricarboxylate transporter substrate binding protein [Variovorax sp. PAMC 28711]|uniref:Bug family tripartite tricarboxylate transporter substrate binding protein n=1 Tax=Variovorax sp. PAMC 28711 TaxID=1795631 RepID=UPI00078B9B7D|nr:tripartite tricarboxylate transporter substrate binding protein [Variovorax sp. PAMC 28711]AMM23047.1 MFS transporter [Variovorax sp. PAMC 28711]